MPNDPARWASAPGKVILFGEHAVNQGEPALAAAVGLRARCRICRSVGYQFTGGGKILRATREQVWSDALQLAAFLAAKDFAALQAWTAQDYFAPVKAVLAALFAEGLPTGLEIDWDSDIPAASGLGSGGAAFVACVAAASKLRDAPPTERQQAAWAHQGDIIAHGGIASALDTQTSRLGGIVRFASDGQATPIPCATGLTLVIGHCGMEAATSRVNDGVRRWLAERPAARTATIRSIGALTRAAVPLLAQGHWAELGRLMTLNQLALAKIGVSCPALERLIEAALDAGAFGAKLSGSGGGGIMIALTEPNNKTAVAAAIASAGGTVYTPEIGVPGVN